MDHHKLKVCQDIYQLNLNEGINFPGIWIMITDLDCNIEFL